MLKIRNLMKINQIKAFMIKHKNIKIKVKKSKKEIFQKMI